MPKNFDFSNAFGGGAGGAPPAAAGLQLPPLKSPNDAVTSFKVVDNDNESQFNGSTKSKTKKFKKKVKKMKKVAVQER
jgi:hypothetical protein